ncbi:AMP-binding protein [Actinophytocola algeriensis]|uniref:Phenylacetate-CoA ligase n=1 Tax=Actinophytocola algeriensis TaxID=1768010 RepID=A0A7W7QFF4_9PSEU|nr:AMP-binding protein [Actinophytocola algeriensis]MBB4912458.1 phenylacetate-CoA ligase [Actinophytocola algeriensis]MBE1480969.1 phenylacetate-CoA ligase [Actinophytocola algeriensis]
MSRHVDYPVADYEPMAATALTDDERWPLMTPAAEAMLTRLRTHPSAPRYNHACGDRLTAKARDSLVAYRTQLADGFPAPDWIMPLVERVYRTVPRYRRGPAPASLTEVPTTDRHDLLSHAEAHVPEDADLSDLIVYRTSGSRGPAATVPMTPEFCALDLPVMQYLLSELGVPLRSGASRVSLVNVYDQPVAYQFASVSSYLDGAGVVKVNLHESGWRTPDDRVAFLDACAPELYTGNPISLAKLAELPLTTRPAAVLSGAMALGEGLRSTLAARFDCPVVDLYGITEAGLVAWRPDNGPHRLLPRRLHVEILSPAGEPCPPGERGEITVTCGENPLLPLLRYRTGDHAALSFVAGEPVLTGLEGRDPVRYRAASGRWVNSIELTHVLSPLDLVAWQLHQDEQGAVTVETHGGAATEEVVAAVRGLLGQIPITVKPGNLARDTKPQRYSSALAGALVS